MAFVPQTPLSSSLLLHRASSLTSSRPRLTTRVGHTAPPRRNFGSSDVITTPVRHASPHACLEKEAAPQVAEDEEDDDTDERVHSADAMEFFRHREGSWSSWRVTHHLAFQRAESGESEISMTVLPADEPRIVQLCRDWEVDPSEAQGGCYVTWKATMAWDQEGENHEGETVFALVPEADDVRRGRILRDRGYAEIVPIAGTYFLDEEDALNLVTPYEGGAVEEKFQFDGIDVVNRSSTVRRFGGLSTATFSTEQRIRDEEQEDNADDEELEEFTTEELVRMMDEFSFFGPSAPAEESSPDTGLASSAFTGRPRWGAQSATSAAASTPANSAFGSGFSAPLPSNSAFGSSASAPAPPTAASTSEASEVSDAGKNNGVTVGEDVQQLAEKAGIDLSKIPPSMRDDFLATLKDEIERNS